MGSTTEQLWNDLDDTGRTAVRAGAEALGCEPAALLAVIEAGAPGRVLARVDGRDEPPIRFRGDVFDRLLTPARRAQARRAGLAHPLEGRVANPRSQGRRWRLLARAIAIDRQAALSATVWGVGAVMGLHWRALGFGSVDALVVEARSGAAGQVALLVRLLRHEGLGPKLAGGEWQAVARACGLDRPALETAHARAAALDLRPALPAIASDDGAAFPLRFGARGEGVRRLQRGLARSGHPLRADGLFGIRTDAALREWQRRRGARPTGAVSPADAWRLLGSREVLAIVMGRTRALLPSARTGA